MAEYGVSFVLTTPASTVTFNAGTGDEYYLDPNQCAGLDMAPVRANVDDRPGTSGGLVHAALKGPRHVTFGGVLLNRTGTATARNTMENTLRSALESILAANGTLVWTPSGGSARTLAVRCDVGVTFAGGFLKTFAFGLVSANADWT